MVRSFMLLEAVTIICSLVKQKKSKAREKRQGKKKKKKQERRTAIQRGSKEQ
jgi:hypothetical protein